MSVSETDSEVSARLEFEQAQRSEGWKLLRGLLRDQRRNLIIGGLVGTSWAAFKVAIPQVTKLAINDGIEKNGPFFSMPSLIASFVTCGIATLKAAHDVPMSPPIIRLRR